jgi:hypothetical protein
LTEQEEAVAKLTFRMVDGETYSNDAPGIPVDQVLKSLNNTEPGTLFVQAMDEFARPVLIAAGYMVSVLVEPS